MKTLASFEHYGLGNELTFHTGKLPLELVPQTADFDTLWAMHPSEYHLIKMHGRLVRTPRWQQAYGTDYHYTGRVNKALPVPPALAPLLAWAKKEIDQRMNGALLNWYDGALGHYIGRHRDSTINLLHGAPIVTISFGEDRIFRLRPWHSSHDTRLIDFQALNGTVFVMPFETNAAWTHEVPAFRKWSGRRISVRLRAFGTTLAHQPTPSALSGSVTNLDTL